MMFGANQSSQKNTVPMIYRFQRLFFAANSFWGRQRFLSWRSIVLHLIPFRGAKNHFKGGFLALFGPKANLEG